MNISYELNVNRLLARPQQKGGLTIFTAIFVLILMTLMLFYATRVGLFEQRVSGNDARQKLAFQAAEAGLDYGAEFFLGAGLRILSKKINAQPYLDGDSNKQYHPGWLSDGNTLWTACPELDPDDDLYHYHPCGEDMGGTGSFFYDDPATTTAGSYDALPLDATLLANLPAGTNVRVMAVICPRTLDNSACDPDLIPEADETPTETIKFSIWMLAYGYSDCNDDDASGSIDIPDECRGRASVTIPFGSIEHFNGKPSVPLVTKNSLPTAGTAEVVPNPDGGGEGVPLSIWANARASECQPLDSDGSVGETIEVDGNFTTCEMQEWYAVDAMPYDGECPAGPGLCQCSINTGETISYRSAGTAIVGMDIMADELFPCDLFEFYFGIPSSDYQTIKANAKVIDDCSILNTESTGFFWFSGDTCTLDDVGTIDNPIILVSAADEKTVINGNSEFWGILYLASVEDTDGDAYFKPGGGATVYGSVIVDVLFPPSNFSGTFKVIYNEAGALNAGGIGSIGGLAGGWRDFGLPDLVWE